MLQSTYLTQNGIRRMLQHIYDKGFKYVFYNSERCVYQASQKEPYFEDDTFMYCDGYRQDFVDGFSSEVLNDLLNGQNYINIAEELEIVDWSKVEVDTKIIVSHSTGSPDYCRYFAEYNDGKVYAWDYGATSWSSDVKSKSWWKHAKLAE